LEEDVAALDDWIGDLLELSIEEEAITLVGVAFNGEGLVVEIGCPFAFSFGIPPSKRAPNPGAGPLPPPLLGNDLDKAEDGLPLSPPEELDVLEVIGVLRSFVFAFFNFVFEKLLIELRSALRLGSLGANGGDGGGGGAGNEEEFVSLELAVGLVIPLFDEVEEGGGGGGGGGGPLSTSSMIK